MGRKGLGRGVKGRIMELLQNGDMQGLETLMSERPGALRHVLGRLWDHDPNIRERAAAAIGFASAKHEAMGLELLRRFAWALNDESATNGVSVIPAIAAIATHAPELSRPFIGQLVAALDDPGLAEEAAAAIEEIRRLRPQLVEPYLGEIAVQQNHDCRGEGRNVPSSRDDEY